MSRLCATQDGRGSVPGRQEEEEGNRLGVRLLGHRIPFSVRHRIPHSLSLLQHIQTSRLLLCCRFEAKKRWETKSNMGFM